MIGRALTSSRRLAAFSLFAAVLAFVLHLAPGREAQAFPIVFPSQLITVAADPTVAPGRPATIGTVAVLSGTSKTYVKTATGDTAWTRTDAGAASSGGGFWTPVASFDLITAPATLSPSFNSRFGTWTKSGSPAVTQVDDGSTNAFLTYESGGAIPANASGVFGSWQQGGWAAEVEYTYTAASAAGTYAGITINTAASAPLATNSLDVRMRRDAGDCGWEFWNIAGHSGGCPYGAVTPGVWHKLHVEILGGNQLHIWVDGVILREESISLPTFSPARVALWSTPGHAQFRNLKIWTMGPAT